MKLFIPCFKLKNKYLTPGAVLGDIIGVALTIKKKGINSLNIYINNINLHKLKIMTHQNAHNDITYLFN